MHMGICIQAYIRDLVGPSVLVMANSSLRMISNSVGAKVQAIHLAVKSTCLIADKSLDNWTQTTEQSACD